MHKFLKSDNTHLMFIDSDLSWGVDGFIRLLTDALSGLEVVGGVYRNKNNWETWGAVVKKDSTGHMVGLEKDKIRVLEAECMPGGFAIYSKDAFYKTAGNVDVYEENGEPVYEFFKCSVEDGKRYGEDLYFQRRFKEVGGRIWVEPDIRISHFGVNGWEGNFHRYLLEQKTPEVVENFKIGSTVNVVMPFSRSHMRGILVINYKKMGVVLNPIAHDSVLMNWGDVPWVRPLLSEPEHGVDMCYKKINDFIKMADIVDDSYYMFMCDDDYVEKDVVPTIKQLDDDVIFLSMKRGDRIPKGGGNHPCTTLFARPENVEIGHIGLEQIVVKGRVLKNMVFNEHSRTADGEMAMWLAKHYKVRFLENRFVLFNFFENGRWNNGGIYAS